MPVLFLEPEKDADGKGRSRSGRRRDRVLDELAARLEAEECPAPKQMTSADEQALERSGAGASERQVLRERATELLEHGIPSSQADVVQGDEALLNPNPKSGGGARRPGEGRRPKSHKSPHRPHAAIRRPADQSANTAATAATTFPAMKTPSQSARRWPIGAASSPRGWHSSRSTNTWRTVRMAARASGSPMPSRSSRPPPGRPRGRIRWRLQPGRTRATQPPRNGVT